MCACVCLCVSVSLSLSLLSFLSFSGRQATFISSPFIVRWFYECFPFNKVVTYAKKKNMQKKKKKKKGKTEDINTTQ